MGRSGDGADGSPRTKSGYGFMLRCVINCRKNDVEFTFGGSESVGYRKHCDPLGSEVTDADGESSIPVEPSVNMRACRSFKVCRQRS